MTEYGYDEADRLVGVRCPDEAVLYAMDEGAPGVEPMEGGGLRIPVKLARVGVPKKKE